MLYNHPKPLRLVGARVILPEAVEESDVWLLNGKVCALGSKPSPEEITSADSTAINPGWTEIDCNGCILAPALVDIHGDAFERQLMPRPGVMCPLEAAVLETDRQLASNGIATAYHAVTISWEPGLRSLSMAEHFCETLNLLAQRLTVDNRVQIRWETFAHDPIPFIEAQLGAERLPSLAFNDHTSMAVLHPDIKLQDRPFEQDDDFPVADMDRGHYRRSMVDSAKRSGMSEEEYINLLKTVWQRRSDVPPAISHLSSLARKVGAPMLSHDDSQTKTRQYYRQLGSRVAEFPMQEEIAEEAKHSGDWVIFGAPNAVRGGSHIGSPGSQDMIAADQCDILASDYYYPSLLLAIGKLNRENVKPLHELWKLVSQNPAEAMQLTDRGKLQVGQSADLVLLEWPEKGEPRPRLTLSSGRVAYSNLTI